MSKIDKTGISRFEKITIFLLLVCLAVIIGIMATVIISINNSDIKQYIRADTEMITEDTSENRSGNTLVYDTYNGEYSVFVKDVFAAKFMSFDEAVEYAKSHENASVKRSGGSSWLWDNTPQFNVYRSGSDEYKAFIEFGDAANYAWENGDAEVFYRKNSSFIWNTYSDIPEEKMISDIEPIGQYPELYRGCEVTSLAMLLRYRGYDVSKMQLAREIKKEPMISYDDDGRQYYGNPNNGFVGNIYDENEEGLGVYHQPMYELLAKYDEKNAVDLSGSRFEDLFYFLNRNIPVAVIVSSEYRVLPEENFEYWDTREGTIRVTFDEHCVLVCGYDRNKIYCNDPMKDGRIVGYDRDNFIRSWIQMGRQAVSVCK
ncbi:MAG: C39 family peptidase [Firmicutes bacterium]|nr:C39 family peptidase [Bacillota bacterium]